MWHRASDAGWAVASQPQLCCAVCRSCSCLWLSRKLACTRPSRRGAAPGAAGSATWGAARMPAPRACRPSGGLSWAPCARRPTSRVRPALDPQASVMNPNPWPGVGAVPPPADASCAPCAAPLTEYPDWSATVCKLGRCERHQVSERAQARGPAVQCRHRQRVRLQPGGEPLLAHTRAGHPGRCPLPAGVAARSAACCAGPCCAGASWMPACVAMQGLSGRTVHAQGIIASTACRPATRSPWVAACWLTRSCQ